jgi:hypothetical protein
MAHHHISPTANAQDVTRDIAGETVHGFRVAAYRETDPEHGDKYGHTYSEHWSTPNTRNPAVRVERMFTETQLLKALTGEAPSQDVTATGEYEPLKWQLVRDSLGYGEIYETNEDGGPGDLVASVYADHEHLIANAPRLRSALIQLLSIAGTPITAAQEAIIAEARNALAAGIGALHAKPESAA